jgi:hypothetical protein
VREGSHDFNIPDAWDPVFRFAILGVGKIPRVVTIVGRRGVLFLAVLAVGAVGAARGSAPTSGMAVRPWCEAKPSAAWRKAFTGGVVALSRRASIVPLATGRDGRTFFATIYSPTFSGVGRIDARTSQVTPIKSFSNAANDQAGGAFDGRWLVWTEYHSLREDDLAVFAWDSRTKTLKQLGATVPRADGSYWPSSWRHPDVSNGVATWEQGTGPDSVGDIHVVQLETGEDKVIRHGHPGGPFFTGRNRIVWPESPRRGVLTVFRAADTRTGATVAPPPVLRGLRGIGALVTDGKAIAYPSPYFGALWWAPSLSGKPSQIAIAGYGDSIDNSVQIAGRYVLFGIAPHTYLADTAQRRYVEISAGGWGHLDARSLVLLPPSPKKELHAVADVLFFSLESLPPVPPCK